MNCTQCREALSAQLDGEESAAEQVTVDAHLNSCAACCGFAEQAARITRLARTAVASQQPDIVESVLAAAPRSHRPRLVTALRALLGLVGLAQVAVALVEMLAAHSSGHGAQGVVLQGASIAHFAHESAAWNLALGVGFLWVAWRPSRTSGMVPTLVTFMVALTVLVGMDAVAGGVDGARLLAHGLVLLGLILVIALDRLPRPVKRTVPGIPTLRRSRPGLPAQTDPAGAGTSADGLPPDLRPTAQQDGAAIAHRRIA